MRHPVTSAPAPAPIASATPPVRGVPVVPVGPNDMQVVHWWRGLLSELTETDVDVLHEAERRGLDGRLLDLTWSLMDADPHRLTMKQLGRRLACTPGGLTKIVDRAEDAQLVLRHASVGDRRVTEIELTAGGEAAFRRVVGEQATRIRRHLESRRRSLRVRT